MSAPSERPGFRERLASRVEADRTKRSQTFSDFGVSVSGGVIKHKRDSAPLATATARVETTGDINRRVTATRLLATGVFAFALKKKQDERELYLTIEAAGLAVVLELKPKDGQKAREFAARINAAAVAGRNAVPAASPVLAPPPTAVGGPPPGWYLRPGDAPAVTRWWDGRGWSEHTQIAAPAR